MNKKARVRYASVSDRIAANISIDDRGCWVWKRRVDRDGYARMNIYHNGKVSTHRVMRVAYSCHVGRIAEGLVLDHRCRNRRCVNPDHLEEVTVAENNERARPKERFGRCKKCGVVKLSNGCRICARNHWRKYAAKKRTELRGGVPYAPKVSDAVVAEVRRLASEGVLQKNIAWMFNISRSHVSSIVRGLSRVDCGDTSNVYLRRAP